MAGKKLDTGKPEYDLLAWEAEAELARVRIFGNKKYEVDNWKGGIKFRRILNAVIRHSIQMLRGEVVDPETGLLHSAHIMTNAEFLTYYLQHYDIYKQFDDLPKINYPVILTNDQIVKLRGIK